MRFVAQMMVTRRVAEMISLVAVTAAAAAAQDIPSHVPSAR